MPKGAERVAYVAFKQAGSNKNRNDKYQFWRQDNRPAQLNTVNFTLSKLEYIHNNPVRGNC